MKFWDKRKTIERRFNELSSADKLEFYYRFGIGDVVVNFFSIVYKVFFAIIILLLSAAVVYYQNLNSVYIGNVLTSVYTLVNLSIFLLCFEVCYNFIVLIYNKYQKRRWYREKGIL